MSRFDGTLALTRLALRRDRVRLAAWAIAIGGLTAASAQAVSSLYDTPQAVRGYAALVGSSPATVAFAGPPLGLDTRAGIVVYEVSFTALVGVALLAVLTMSRHSRAEEESGRSELLRATVVGRHAGGAAALLVAGLASLLVATGVLVALLPSALSVRSALVYAAGVGLLGLAMAALTLVCAQVFSHARAVTGAGLGLFALAYAARAAGDVRGDGLVWLSPVGWVQATHVPTEDRWWPLLLPLALTGAAVAVAVHLAERRDFGAGMLPARAAPAHAPRSLRGPVGLAWRQQRGAVVGWGSGLLLMAALTGTLGNAMQDMVRDNPALAAYLELTSGGSVVDAYLATMLLILALCAGGFAVWSSLRGIGEEESGRIDLLLATPTSRGRAYLGEIVVTVAGTGVVLGAAAIGEGLGHAAATTDAGEGVRVMIAQLAYVPALLVLIGAAYLCRGLAARLAWPAWTVLSFAFVIGWLGGLLDPPQWVVNLSPFAYVPRVPVESAVDGAQAVLLVVAVALMAGGLLALRRRDIG